MKIVPGRRALPEEQRAARRALTLILVVGGMGAAALVIRPPVPGDIYAPCPWHHVTGTWCPGCGSLRGLYRLLRGDVAGFARYNALAAAMLPFLAWSLAGIASRAVARYRLPQLVPGRFWILGLGLLIIAWGVARNLIPVLAPPAG